MANTAPKVFISYSHDSPEHEGRVLALANRLRQDGLDALVDQYVSAPAVGWLKWMDKEIQAADFVLLICTETYLQRVEGREQGKGREVMWESDLIYDLLYEQSLDVQRFVPALFAAGQPAFIPLRLRQFAHYYVDTEEGYQSLYRHLTNQPRNLKPELGARPSLAAREPQSYPSSSKHQLRVLGNQVFISYSHKDAVWLEKLMTTLRPLIRNQTTNFWADTRIQAGAEWRDEIQSALASAKVAVLLVSQHFLASDYITNHELPLLLQAAKAEGLIIVWVPVSSLLYEGSDIGKYQALIDPRRPLDSLNSSEQNKALVDIAKEIKRLVDIAEQIAIATNLEVKNRNPADGGSVQPQRLKVFLCHSSADKPAVRNLYHRLLTDGFDPWLDIEKLFGGTVWRPAIQKAIRSSDAIVVCLSRSSITKEGFVQNEIKQSLAVCGKKSLNKLPQKCSTRL